MPQDKQRGLTKSFAEGRARDVNNFRGASFSFGSFSFGRAKENEHQIYTVPSSSRALTRHPVACKKQSLGDHALALSTATGTIEGLLRRLDELGLLATTHGAGSAVIVPSPSGEG